MNRGDAFAVFRRRSNMDMLFVSVVNVLTTQPIHSRLGLIAGVIGAALVAVLFVWVLKGTKASRLMQLARLARYVGELSRQCWSAAVIIYNCVWRIFFLRFIAEIFVNEFGKLMCCWYLFEVCVVSRKEHVGAGTFDRAQSSQLTR